MPFFMVDDQFHLNRKVEQCIDMGQTGMAALGLWSVVGSKIQAGTPTDGQVSDSSWRTIGDKRLFAKLSAILVDVGLWESRDSGEPGWQYHDWFDVGYTPGAKVNLNRKRTKELKNPDIVLAVRARDGEQCRYCGRKVDWNDKRSDKGATYDHVIPGLAKGITNLVVCCRKCNRDKAQRTPEQAGMTLLPPPHPAADPDQLDLVPDLVQGPNPGSNPIQIDDQIDGQVSATPHRTRSRNRSGSRSGSGSGSGQDRGRPRGAELVTAGPAGQAPPFEPSPGHTGSPWFGHRGRSPDLDEPTCPDHGLDMPCTKCTRDHFASEGSTT